jgi:hypothetical protein
MNGFNPGHATEHTIKQTDFCHKLFLLSSQAHEGVEVFRAREEKRGKDGECNDVEKKHLTVVLKYENVTKRDGLWRGRGLFFTRKRTGKSRCSNGLTR